MFAAHAMAADADDPLAALRIGEIEPGPTPADWVEVEVRAASLNHHDVWSLRGVGLPADRLPMILGCDAAGVTADGREVIVHAVLGDPDFAGPDETFDPARSLLSERYPGTLAERVRVPAANLVDKPSALSYPEAACLPTAWLTAYRMLFVAAGLRPGQTVLVQGAGGGVATALVLLGRHSGLRVWVTSRDPERAERAVALGAHAAFGSGSRLPEKVDAVLDTVGAATWSHSINSLKPGGTLVLSGTTSGAEPDRAELTKIFFKPLRVIGSTMGTRAELVAVTAMLVATGVRPPIDRILPLADARAGFAALIAGDVFGKVVLEPGLPAWGERYPERAAGSAAPVGGRASPRAKRAEPTPRRPRRTTAGVWSGAGASGSPSERQDPRPRSVDERARERSELSRHAFRRPRRTTAGVWSGAGASGPEEIQSSSSSRRASQVASRSTGISNSGFRSTKARSCSASHARVTSSSPLRVSSSSMPRSVKYT